MSEGPVGGETQSVSAVTQKVLISPTFLVKGRAAVIFDPLSYNLS